MNKQFRYVHKNVQDLEDKKGMVRVWDASGDVDKKGILKGFEPLLRTGFVYPYIALMPDHHPSEGSHVGSVIPTKDVLLLSVVGGDLGCGMSAVKLPLREEQIQPLLPRLHTELNNTIPSGSSHNRQVTERVADNPIWDREVRADIYSNRNRKKLMLQFASLGGGNHFLELQKDEEGALWIMLHSGSRYLGVLIRDYYIKLSGDLETIDPAVHRRIPYIPAHSDLAESYLSDLHFAMTFARESRREMMLRALEVMVDLVPGLQQNSVEELSRGIHDVAHNYVQREEHFDQELYIHRKGAVRAYYGDTVMIPGSMGTSSYIAIGRGNGFSFSSCSHGAGRSMSRSAALKSISDKDFSHSTSGIIHNNDTRLKDEAPEAYKAIQSVMRGQKDLVKIQTILEPLLSLKGV